ncbi:MAG: hypothetical protein ACR2QC_08990 [Gammaproteobacteria bacterium]
MESPAGTVFFSPRCKKSANNSQKYAPAAVFSSDFATYGRISRRTTRIFRSAAEFHAEFRPPTRPIPAKAGISAAAKRREIVPPSATVYAFGAEIPAFAGMELKRFRLSPEWRHFLFLRTIPNSVVSRNIKKPPFRRKPESHFCVRRREAAGKFAPSARRFLPSQEWDGGGNRAAAGARIYVSAKRTMCSDGAGVLRHDTA